MKINSSEMKQMMNKLEEKIEELEEQLNLEKDIDIFELNYHKIEDYREELEVMAKKKKKSITNIKQ